MIVILHWTDRAILTSRDTFVARFAVCTCSYSVLGIPLKLRTALVQSFRVMMLLKIYFGMNWLIRHVKFPLMFRI